MRSCNVQRAVSSGLFLILSLSAVSAQTGGTNYWIKPNSGYWEEQAFWSLGVLPDASQAVVFNNPGFKALAIGAQTVRDFPQSLSVQSLQVESPVDSFNTLLMNFSGFERALQTFSLIVGSNSAVVMQSSSLEVINPDENGSAGNLILGGTFNHGDYSQVKVDGTLRVFRERVFVTDILSPAAYFLTNGILIVNRVEQIGGVGPGAFVQYGGSNIVASLGVSIDGEYQLYDGQLTATNGVTVGFGDFADLAGFIQYGGHVDAATIINGHYVLKGGEITGRMSVPSGTEFQRVDGDVLQEGGTNYAIALDLGHPNRFGGRGTYVLSNGVLRVDSLLSFRGGEFLQYDGVHTVVSNLVMQGTDVGLGFVDADYFLGGGMLSAGSVAVNSASTLTQSQGVLRATSLSMNLEATVSAGVLNLHGGSVVVSNAVELGWGNIELTGGHLQAPGLTAFQSEIRQSGGTNEVGEFRWPRNRLQPGQGNYYLSGGTLLSSNLNLGDGAPGGFAGLNGVFQQSGGVHNNSDGIVIWGTERQAEARPNGEYRLLGGLLVSPSIQLPTGSFIQNGGTNHVGVILLQDAATFALQSGLLSTSNTTIGSRLGRYYMFGELQSFHLQTGGHHDATQFNAIAGGRARLLGGSLSASNISVGPEALLELAGANVTNAGTFTILGSTRVSANGTYPELGKLILQSAPPSPCCPPPTTDVVLDFGANAATLHFRDSRDASWSWPLFIANWSGSSNGGGTDRLIVGTSAQGLTPAQLALIRFVNPAGLPAGTYPAVILASGEVVPGPRPLLSMTRSSSGLVMSWSGNYQLVSSTNVTGPYAVLSSATSPYTNSLDEPQRFFYLRSP